MCLLRVKNVSSILLSQRRSLPKIHSGSQLRLLASSAIGRNKTKRDECSDAKKIAPAFQPSHEYNADSFQLPPPSNSSNSQTIWLAALAFILGINVGGAYIVYNTKVKKEVEDPKKSARSKKPRVPLNSSEIPRQVPYLIIGGGTASFSAFRAIRSKDPQAKILVLSKELDTPYMRPPLSKELWTNNVESKNSLHQRNAAPITFKQWNGIDRDLHYEPNDFYIHPSKLMNEPSGGVAIVQGYSVNRIDVENRTAILDDGTKIEYGECLIATGSSPKTLPVFERAAPEVRERISMFKTIDDYSILKKYVDKSKSVAIIGGGFLGSELACGLAKYGVAKKLKVHQVFIEEGNMGKVLPQFLSKWTTDRVREQGVNVIPNTDVVGADYVNGQVKLTLRNGRTLSCDHVVLAVGSEPNVSLAEESGLEIDTNHGGFVVNSELEARNHVYVAGDAASFYDPKYGRRRVEHHDHAVVSGRVAGENMLGMHKPYTHQSMFWSDLGPNVAYEGLGIIDSSLPTVSVFAKNDATTTTATATTNKTGVMPSVSAADLNEMKDDFSKGVVFYMNDDKIVGIVLWNVFDEKKRNTARAILNHDRKYDDLNEVAKLFDIHSQH